MHHQSLEKVEELGRWVWLQTDHLVPTAVDPVHLSSCPFRPCLSLVQAGQADPAVQG